MNYDVLSPDGFSIERGVEYTSIEKAKAALKKWVKTYERQGYYSSNSGRISLEDLPSNCKIVEINSYE